MRVNEHFDPENGQLCCDQIKHFNPENGQQFCDQIFEHEQILSLYQQARNQFVFKVYLILATQLLITAMFVGLAVSNPSFAHFQRKYLQYALVSVGMAIMTMILIICSKKLAETFPANMIVLGIFTLAQSYIVSFICSIYDKESVILAAGVTAAATIGITLYVRLSGTDFSKIDQIIAGLGISMVPVLLFLVVVSLLINIPLISSIISFFFVIIYMIFLIYDTRMLMDNAKHQVNLDQYVKASMLLYVDIVSIFLNILKGTGNRRK